MGCEGLVFILVYYFLVRRFFAIQREMSVFYPSPYGEYVELRSESLAGTNQDYCACTNMVGN